MRVLGNDSEIEIELRKYRTTGRTVRGLETAFQILNWNCVYIELLNVQC